MDEIIEWKILIWMKVFDDVFDEEFWWTMDEHPNEAQMEP
jgi:hypothetical protein